MIVMIGSRYGDSHAIHQQKGTRNAERRLKSQEMDAIVRKKTVRCQKDFQRSIDMESAK